MEQELLTRLASLEAYVRLDAVEKLANTPWPEADSERADLANVTLFRFQDIEFDIRAEMLKAAEGWGPDAVIFAESILSNILCEEPDVSIAALDSAKACQIPPEVFCEFFRQNVRNQNFNSGEGLMRLVDLAKHYGPQVVELAKDLVDLLITEFEWSKDFVDIRWDVLDALQAIGPSVILEQRSDDTSELISSLVIVIRANRDVDTKMRALRLLENLGVDIDTMYPGLRSAKDDEHRQMVQCSLPPEALLYPNHTLHPGPMTTDEILEQAREEGVFNPFFNLVIKSKELCEEKHLSTLLNLSRSEDTTTRVNIIGLLSAVESNSSHPTRAIQRISEMLDDDEGICQLMALEAIGEHGVRSVAALPKVERAMQSEDSQIHIAALKSAQRIKRALAKARQADS